jgi:hypothetical protein
VFASGDRMPMIWGLSKSAANYRPATRPELQCAECKFTFPRLAIGGAGTSEV